MTINVFDCNDKPSEISFTSSLAISENRSYTIVIPENSPNGTSLVKMSVVDDDVGQQHNCLLLTGRDFFDARSLNKSSSEVYVSQSADLDYERNSAPIQGISFIALHLNRFLLPRWSHSVFDRPFAVNDHMVQNPPC